MSLLEGIGQTPLIDILGLHVKLECANPGGSVKDRIARFMLEQASRRGELKPGDVIVEATSGNTGIALALIGREMGHRVLILMPEHMTIERRLILERLGAEVRLTPKGEGFEGAIARRDAFLGIAGHYVPDQFGNPDNTLCHRRTTGAEIVRQLHDRGVERADFFVAGVGTGGTLMGVGQALREANPGVRLVAVEPDESAVMSGGEPGEHGIGGIGDGFIPALVDMKTVDEVIRVGTDEAHETAATIRSEHGYCVGRSAGANTAAALRLKRRGGVVVTLWPDCADRYLSVGLLPPAQRDVKCDLRIECRARASQRLGDTGSGSC